jgi:hypothetical protein
LEEMGDINWISSQGNILILGWVHIGNNLAVVDTFDSCSSACRRISHQSTNFSQISITLSTMTLVLVSNSWIRHTP